MAHAPSRRRAARFAVAAAVLATLWWASPSEADTPSPPSLTLESPHYVSNAVLPFEASFTETGSAYLVAICRRDTDYSDILQAGSRCDIRETGTTTTETSVISTTQLPDQFSPFLGPAIVDCVTNPCELAVAISDDLGTFPPINSLKQVVATPIEPFGRIHSGDSARPGDDVRVMTTIFGEADATHAVQCAIGPPARACAIGEEVDPSAHTVSVTLRRFLDDGGSLVDCASTSCGVGIQATGLEGTSGPLTFLRPIEILPPTIPTATSIAWVSDVPTIGGMSATGLPETSWGTSMWQCVESLMDEPLDVATACGPSDATTNPGASTTYEGTMTLHREIVVDGVTHDCEQVACVLALSGWTSPAMTELGDVYTREIRYRGLVYKRIDFILSGGVRIGDTVRFFADTYLPDGGTWDYSQCIGEPTLETRAQLCDTPVPLGPDSQGNGAVARQPAKSVIETDSGPHRCYRDRCTAMVTYTPPGGETGYFLRPIELASQVHVPEWSGLVDGQTIHIEEIDVLPTAEGSGVFVMQCGADLTGAAPRIGCGNAGTAEAHDGHFVGEIAVRSSFELANGGAVHCTDTHPCALALVALGPAPEILGGSIHPIRFATP